MLLLRPKTALSWLCRLGGGGSDTIASSTSQICLNLFYPGDAQHTLMKLHCLCDDLSQAEFYFCILLGISTVTVKRTVVLQTADLKTAAMCVYIGRPVVYVNPP